MKNKGNDKKQLINKRAGPRGQLAKLNALKGGYNQTEKIYEHFFNLSNDMLCVAGLDGYFKLLNPAFENVLGYTKEELFAKPFFEFVYPEDREKNRAEVQSLSAGIPIVYCEHRYLCKDGSYKWLAWTSHTDVEEGLIYAVARDITERKQAEEAKLIHANKMTALGTLVSGVAHEINNPNTFIKSNARLFSKIWKSAEHILEEYYRDNGEFLMEEIPYSEVREFAPKLLKAIDEGSMRIQGIVDGLRDFVRPEKASLDGKVNVNDVVNAARSVLSHQINKYTDNFEIISENNIPFIKGSSQQIEQVLINLIMNSLQALPDKSRGVQASTVFDKESGSAIIQVKDEGIGIASDIIERITEPFFTTKSDIGGTGLGLSISYAIIKEHNGSLEFESEPGRGTTVKVKLPIYR
ncbi:MAG: hypothetical protein A2W05_10640 [Candidatus Schekmanbacteria bacterium RBG_16_38_10]|uniref:histidine kinase n=1 Tax=Candidatus Schekmanbacteria bacterium RBG_16_38_10 TaxID=1817879 RepID=A0A1F7RY82_9BACT|nr:MAG: hypothetical protein A2W05_10640 [Candidatus Schekmanbacteria bacterium RBG_16_38_10]